MKKLLTITFILSAFYCSGQTMPYFSKGQSDYLRTYMKASLDSAYKVWIADAKKADTALYKTLPVISKENLAAVNALSTTLSALTVRLKGISDTISMLSKNTVDTSQKKAIQDLQKNYDALLTEFDGLTVDVEVLKLWADRIKAIGTINFK